MEPVTPADEARTDLLCQAFQACIDGPEPAAERTAEFTIDGAAYYRVTPAQRTALLVMATRRVWNLNAAIEDPQLPHQIVSIRVADGIAVTCNCLRRPGPVPGGTRGAPRQLIAVRAGTVPFTVPEALAAWRGWHEKQGVQV